MLSILQDAEHLPALSSKASTYLLGFEHISVLGVLAGTRMIILDRSWARRNLQDRLLVWEWSVRGQRGALAGKEVHHFYVEERWLLKMKQWGLTLLSEIMGISGLK